LEWIEDGLEDLRRVLRENDIRSVAIPPLGSGNGGLDWASVRDLIVRQLGNLEGTRVVVYEPTQKYQNVSKRAGVESLTPARALIAELVRRYSILGIECTLLEIQKLGYILERVVETLGLENRFDFKFSANKFGPYSDRLSHLLNGLDGSYLHCDKRLGDAGPFDVIRFDDTKKDKVLAYLTTADAKIYRDALDVTSKLIDGLESPFGMELLATVDWLVYHEGVEPIWKAVQESLRDWPGGDDKAKERKVALFDGRVIEIALQSLLASPLGDRTG
jgi:hypothetical protein